MALSRIRIALLAVLLAAASVLLAGCWDRLEIEERAVVLGIAIDLAEGNSQEEQEEEEPQVSHTDQFFPAPDTGLIKVTVQIAIPGRIPLGPSEGGGGSGRSGKPVWVLSATGHTVDDAMMVLQQELADRMFLGHLRVVVISEAYARRSVENLNDFFRRNPEVRRLAWMVVSKGRAEKLIASSPELERVPALYLLAMMDHAVEMGKYPNEFAGIFWSKESSKGTAPHIPYVEIKEDEKIAITGMACFRNHRLVMTTKPHEIGYFMAVTGVWQGGYTGFVPAPDGKGTHVMYRATSRKSRTAVRLVNGEPVVNIKVEIEGNIEEKSTEKQYWLNDSSKIAALEQQLSKGARRSHQRLIERTQEHSVDIFGFGEYVRAYLPGYWNREIRTKERWEQKYRDLDVEYEVQFKIRRVGMKAR